MGRNTGKGQWLPWIAAVLLVAVMSGGAEAQTASAGVRGTVREPSGVMPGVVVQLIDEATKASREAVTNDQGEYSFPAVPTGAYTLRVAVPGFTTVERKGLTAGSAPLTLDIPLEVGGFTEAVVVTAGGFEQKITDAPASISVITREDLQAKQFDNLAEALTQVEGVDTNQSTGKTGGLEISIRGLPPTYTLYMIDGRRQNNAGDVTPNGFSEAANNFLPPPSAIERIEVIRGPMSSLYGSDAVGGVVNIITRRTADSWGGAADLDHTVQENRGYSESASANVYAAGPLARGLAGLAVRSRFLNRGPADLTFSDGSRVSRRGVSAVEGYNANLGARLTLTPRTSHDITVDVDGSRQRYNNDDCQLGTLDGWSGTEWAGCTAVSNQAGGYRDALRFNRNQVAVGHRSVLGFGYLESALTYKFTETIGRTVPGTIGVAWTGFGIVGSDPRTLESTDVIFDTKLSAQAGSRHTLTIGGQYIDADAVDGLATTPFRQTWRAVFGEDQWNLLDNLAVTVGGRYEHHTAFGGHFTPRGYLTFAASDRWTVKGGVGQGYRVPTINQLHDGINGAILQGTFLTIGSPGLKPETSTNYEAGVYFNSLGGFDANLTVFHTDFRNMIGVGVPLPNCWSATSPNLPGCVDFGSGFTQVNFAQSINVDSAMSQGAELAVGWRFAPRWRVNGNYTYADTEQKSGVDAGMPITVQPRNIVNTGLDWDATDRLRMWLRSEHYGSRPRFPNRPENLTPADRAALDGLGRLKGYEQFHLGGSYRVSRQLTLNATVYNLLDRDFLECGLYTSNTGATVCGSRYFQLGRVPAGHTTYWGTTQDRRRYWLSANVRF